MNGRKLAAVAVTLLYLVALSTVPRASAAPAGQAVEYKAGDTACEGYLALPAKAEGRAPGVLVVHDWMGVADFARGVCDKLAGLGYVAFACDVYGKGVRPQTPQEAGKQAGTYKGDRALFRERLRAGLDVLAKRAEVDPARIAAIGYCFGGTGALELARSGAAVVGAVSFHGGLDSPTPADAKNVRGKVLALHGADDPYVPPKEVQDFVEEMRGARVDWQLVHYGNSVHAFTNPAAGNDASKGAAYNAAADRRSWEAMKAFFAEVFAK
jgi:dienelactone hydrolase